MIDRRIVEFLKKHHVLSIATSVEDQPWCASCFYVYLEKENALVFTTDLNTRHGQEFLKNPRVAGTMALETIIIGKIRGVQFEGIISQPDEGMESTVRNAYLKRFPVAMLMETHLWIVKLTYLKYTDNRLGFGKKLIWKTEKTSA
ncbi:MAG: pyridoxamine 5'-phosphate oxidase family protein [Bacteroidales bacterium]|nr:pyridoxamine 5'-phosphate oxidase family protein [Bacteroidales bacterium]